MEKKKINVDGVNYITIGQAMHLAAYFQFY